jgi:hypothetical protein
MPPVGFEPTISVGERPQAILTNAALARSNSALPDDGDYTETCWSCFNVDFDVNFRTVFKTIMRQLVNIALIRDTVASLPCMLVGVLLTLSVNVDH